MRKQIRKQKRIENPVIPAEEDPASSLYVHNAEQGLQVPPNPNDMFAVLRVKGLQYKVSKDDRVMVEKLDFEVGTQVEFDEVLLVGTKDYTAVGRPVVESAKILATIEE